MLARRRLAVPLVTAALASVALATGCGTQAQPARSSGRIVTRPPVAAGSAAPVRWRALVSTIPRVLDLAGPRSDGRLVVAGAGRLWLLSRAGAVTPYASAYRSPGGEEPYIALPGRGCFGRSAVFALHLRPPRGVVAVPASGAVRVAARISARGLIDGIAYDATGRFGHRLLVTVNAGGQPTVLTVGCRGQVRVLTRHAPRVEGGIAVAPASFGRFAGELIAPDEKGGRLWAIAPSGTVTLLAHSGLPHGPDIGVESLGFLPRRFSYAVVADRRTPGNRHPGDDFVLALRAATLRAAGARTGDLLAVTEGGARTDLIRCGPGRCSVRELAAGPPEAHGEGHVAFF